MTDELNSVIVPKHMLEELEEARKELHEVIIDTRTLTHLHRVTSIMYRLANRRWPECADAD